MAAIWWSHLFFIILRPNHFTHHQQPDTYLKMAQFFDISGKSQPLNDDRKSDNGVAEFLYDMYHLCLTKKTQEEAAETLYLMEKYLRKNKVTDEELLSLTDKVTEHFAEKSKPQPSQIPEGFFYGLRPPYCSQKDEKYTDVEIALALTRLVGEDCVINLKWKWAGAYWYLRWTCDYPVDVQEFCDRIRSLRLNLPPGYECSYENIRKICSLSFMRYDVNHMDKVRYSERDADVFCACRQVAMSLGAELRRTHRGE